MGFSILPEGIINTGSEESVRPDAAKYGNNDQFCGIYKNTLQPNTIRFH
jgi:hypothetical protein